VFSFPIASPEGAVCVPEVNALEQLHLAQIYNKHWCEHKASLTVYYSDDEFFDVANWIWNNFDDISGISLLPRSDHIYQQAPYQSIDEVEYRRLVSNLPRIDWKELANYEAEDNTTSSKELACTSNGCEL
jgi:ribonucleoside-diphosphate reductase alpha chain